MKKNWSFVSVLVLSLVLAGAFMGSNQQAIQADEDGTYFVNVSFSDNNKRASCSTCTIGSSNRTIYPFGTNGAYTIPCGGSNPNGCAVNNGGYFFNNGYPTLGYAPGGLTRSYQQYQGNANYYGAPQYGQQMNNAFARPQMQGNLTWKGTTGVQTNGGLRYIGSINTGIRLWTPQVVAPQMIAPQAQQNPNYSVGKSNYGMLRPITQEKPSYKFTECETCGQR